MNGFAWKMNRIRTMGTSEIIHRVRESWSHKIEGGKVTKGWQPMPTTVEPGTSLFPQLKGIADTWNTYFSLDEKEWDEIVSGRIGFFGHKPVDVGNPVNWHRDPFTGKSAPKKKYGKAINYRDDALVGNVKFLWELGRHQHLVPLAVAYCVTGKERYKKSIVDQIEGWIKSNPFARGIHWCSALEVALRLISWAMVHSFFVLKDGGDGLFDQVGGRATLGNSIYQQTWFVAHYYSLYSSANNHLIGELTGVWTASQVFELGEEGQKWGAQAHIELELEAEKQVFSDGVDKEQALYYHLWVLEYLLFADLVADRSGKPFSAHFKERIKLMAGFLRDVTPPGGQPPHIGDADDGFVCRFEPTWSEDPYEEVINAQAFIFGSIPETLTEKAFWYGLIAGKDLAVSPLSPDKKNISPYPRTYSEAGYAVLGDEKIHLVFDAGSLGYPSIAAHGHADALSFCLAIDGQWWFVDPGTYAYHSLAEWRNYFRGTRAHNTLEIDGTNQSDIGGPFLWVRHAVISLDAHGSDLNSQWAEGHHDGYEGLGIIHRRRIVFLSQTQEVKIIDQIEGTGEHELSLFFHLHPDVDAVKKEDGVWVLSRSKSTKSVNLVGDHNMKWEIFQGCEKPILGWYSPRLDRKEQSVTLKGQWRVKVPVCISTELKVEESV